ncbi:restriction endonuclease subunit S [Lactiplantibacillus plantarum]|mgnify:CR=1 FL=1|jgi:type I restriction enzyme S subunit|uniref:restriction endonuclease subunit S n=1 Tax=Lactiplantibacillus plantarum TaxID=1590 RepID=UPI003F53093C
MGNKSVKLGNVADVRDGTHDSPSYQDKGFPLVTTRCFSGTSLDMTQAKSISKADYDAINTRSRVDQYDILVSMIGTVGIVYQETDTEIKYAIKNVGLIKCHGNAVLSDWIYYWLNSNMGQQVILERLHGTTQKFISLTDLRNLPLGELPSQSVMKTRTDALKQLDAKIKLNQQINKNLLKLAVLEFNKWLDFNQSNQYTSLDKIANFKNGIAMQKFPPTDNVHVLPVLKIRELNQGYIDSSSGLVTSAIDDDVKVYNGDLIFSWSGTLSVKIWTDGDAALNQHLFKVTSDRWPKWFYYMWILHHLQKFRGIAADKKTTMGHIKRKDLTNAGVLIPNVKEFKDLDIILNPIIEQIINVGIESKNLANIRNIMLPKLLSGSIDLSGIEEVIKDA